MVRQQLWWAVVHDMRDRVRLLVDAGADIASPVQVEDDRPSWARTTAGRSAAQVAALCGCPELAAWLVERGSPPPPADGVDAFIAAALSGDRREVERLGSHRDQARADRPALIVWAAARRLRGAVVLLAELGFDVNALGRSDIPVEQPWETALHEAAGRGDADLVRTLLDLGANPDMHDARFHATPLGWAEHFDQGHIIQLLGPLTEQ
jgi:ankyrin repeat protein